MRGSSRSEATSARRLSPLRGEANLSNAIASYTKQTKVTQVLKHLPVNKLRYYAFMHNSRGDDMTQLCYRIYGH